MRWAFEADASYGFGEQSGIVAGLVEVCKNDGFVGAFLVHFQG